MGKPETKYDFSVREEYWQNFWDREHFYDFDPSSTEPLYSIDTPPPTISGFLHLGHVFSYTQAEVISRHMRMSGYNVRYPFGLDDNGLPTERLVEKERGVRGKDMNLNNFVDVCLDVTKKYRGAFESLWKSMGFSYDWRLEYSTISPEVQKISQTAFKELFDKGKIYRKEAPALYCHECSTTVAQAEVEDSEKDSVFYDIAFEAEDEKELIISTTRPELMPACVGVFVNPEDKRYKHFIGKTVTTPLGDKVQVRTDENALMDKGTGAVMCCTYGDETDVTWVRKHKLQEKIILKRNGTIDGMSIADARLAAVETLRDKGALKGENSIKHNVGVHERCGTPIEIIPTTQWFVRILEAKDKMIVAGDKINWHPGYMRKRYHDWVEGLKWDWCISRERFFGIPIPAYICNDCSEITVPEADEFPIDPKVNTEQISCIHCSGTNINPEAAVLDTWFTSALTPDINNAHSLNGELKGKMYPMSMRPQAHDIIRTWAVYSILMGLYRHGEVPWKDLMISGHVLVKKGEKISKKTGGGQYKPEELISINSADAIRYAMCGAGLGKDAFYDEGEVKNGKKLVTKLYNAGKFTLNQLADFNPNESLPMENMEAMDQWILIRLNQTASRMQRDFARYEVGQALKTFEEFFWSDFADNYLEIVKGRLYDGHGKEKLSAQSSLYSAFLGILKLASPFVPHITEEMYHSEIRNVNPETGFGIAVSDDASGYFSRTEGIPSVHISLWPTTDSIGIDSEELTEGVKLVIGIVSEMRKYKTTNQIRLGEPMGKFIIKGDKEKLEKLTRFIGDLAAVSKAEEVILMDNKNRNLQASDLLISI